MGKRDKSDRKRKWSSSSKSKSKSKTHEHARSRSRKHAAEASKASNPATSSTRKRTFGGFSLAPKPSFGGFSFAKKKPVIGAAVNVFASAGKKSRGLFSLSSSKSSSSLPAVSTSKEEKFRLRRQRAAELMKRKKEEQALAAMTEEQRKQYEKQKKLEKIRHEIEKKDRDLAQAEEARRQQRAVATVVDPLEQFMQHLQSPSTSSVARHTPLTTGSSGTAPAPSKQVSRHQTISLEDIMKQQQIQEQKQKRKQKNFAPPSQESQSSQDDGVDGGSFLDAMEGTAQQNIALENQIDSEVSGSDVDDETFHEEFRRELARLREAERRQQEAKRIEEEKAHKLEEKELARQRKAQEGLGVIFDDPDSDSASLLQSKKGKTALELLREKMKKKELKKVDHSKQNYLTIRKDFYVEHPRVSRMDAATVRSHLKRMEIKVRGKHAPKPMLEWDYAGLDWRILRILQKQGFQAPFAIQAMAIPALMAGRDIIGVAKTGSGKTLAFLLPLFRHVMDQPTLADGEGPIGLIMAPARELAVQIYKETKKFTKILQMRTVAVYGGSPMTDQINALKRGAEIVVATPGRFIDLLTLNAGKLIKLSRVSYLVLDEADRMFDMGFEPQIAMVTKNIRPDRQTAMFSATFPSHVERLARKLLRRKPLEIIVGGRSKVASEIDQHVEIRNENQKFLRLLQLLGLWHGKGSVLIFTDTQELCDKLYTKLMKAGYYCLSLHSGKDQSDREQAISDFKNQFHDIMVATSLAGRGLDVKSLSLVVNFSCPNHLEDYVQRCGRTGRAGNKGTAYTFIDPVHEEQFVPDVVKALRESGVEVPQPVLDLQESFLAKVKAGTAKKAISGYKGKGHKFDGDDADEVAMQQELQKMRHEVGAGIRDVEELVEAEQQFKQMQADKEKKVAAKKAEGVKSVKKPDAAQSTTSDADDDAKLRAQLIAQRLSAGGSIDFDLEAAVKTAKLARARGATVGAAVSRDLGKDGSPVFQEELEINDYPQKARRRVLGRDVIQATQEFTGAAITSKGSYIQPGRKPKEGERKLYLLIQGPTAISVNLAKGDLMRTLEEVTMEVGFDKSMIAGKYSVA